MELRERVLRYLSLYPSIGILRLAADLGLKNLEPLRELLRELEEEGLVEVNSGVVNYTPWLHGFVEAGYLASQLKLEAIQTQKRRVTLLDFA